ncbi:MAG: helix-turn-helix transcriptional regulator [Terriglobia bacterium]
MNTKQFKRLRKRMRLTQAELARELSVSRAAVSRWESGKRNIDNVLAFALACLAEKRRMNHGRGK